jgi:hypothetical protein
MSAWNIRGALSSLPSDMGQYELLDTLPLHVDERADQGKGLACFLNVSSPHEECGHQLTKRFQTPSIRATPGLSHWANFPACKLPMIQRT